MMPMTLSIVGLRSYPTAVTVDFTGKSLAAVLGDTGAGKSSLLEAITYALFSKSTWDARDTVQLIADQAEAMSVELTFRHDGQRWRVHRTRHATNPNAGRHHLTNLDTGEEVDGARAVDTRIKYILQMDCDTFLRVGLLPQGQFDQLLTASPTVRTTLLRQLFGADSLAEVRQSAVDQETRLTVLMATAVAKREPLHADPAQAATEFAARAAAAKTEADRLDTAIAALSALQNDVAQANHAAATAAADAKQLSDNAVRDAHERLNVIAAAADNLSLQRQSLERRSTEAGTSEIRLAADSAAIEKRGEGRDALNHGAKLLKTLAVRTEDLRVERAAAAERRSQLATEYTEIAAHEHALAQRRKDIPPLTEDSETASRLARTVQTSATVVRTRISQATATATAVAKAVAAHRTAEDNLTLAQSTATQLQADASAATTVLEAADASVAELVHRNQAAAIAADLHPGQECPICCRELPPDFQPVAGASGAAVTVAKSAQREAKAHHEQMATASAKAEIAAETAEEAVKQRANDHRQAIDQADKDAAQARQALADFNSAAKDGDGCFDADTATKTLTSALTALASAEGAAAEDPDKQIQHIISALTQTEQAVADHARQLQVQLLRVTTSLDAEDDALSNRKRLHADAARAAEKEAERVLTSITRINHEVHELPDRVRALLPSDAMTTTVSEVTVAEALVSELMAHVEELVALQELARAEHTNVLTAQRALDQKHRDTVEVPLGNLRTRLNAWADVAERVTTRVSGTNQLPPRLPTASGVEEVQQYASTLAAAAARLSSALAEQTSTASLHANAALESLRDTAASLDDVDGFDIATDLMLPSALHPIVAARTKSLGEAEICHANEQTAQAQVPVAANLDFAITAAQTRLDALHVLRTQLVDSKFLNHLTTRNTRALLGIASDLLGKLSGDSFGFAEDFAIVSRNSETVHHPGRLSGGEKFLASLALALALAELHSHSGPRLGSLFLDEGFATLDMAALESALDVLRAQAGSDRLVIVISHLHAVAEAVDDVLWVKREPAGSTARWLSAVERDELIQSDMASGLQTLA